MSDSEQLEHEYEQRIAALTYVCERLDQMVRDALTIPHVDRIAFRVKDITSFVTKALKAKDDGTRKYDAPFRQIEDQVAGRVIVFFRSDLEPARKCVVKILGPVEYVRKEPAGPSAFGYESDHFVFTIPEHVIPREWSNRFDVPTTFEMQIRTLFQHAWAEPQHDIGYKGRALSDETKRELAWIAASAWGADTTLDRVQHRMRDGEPSSG
jgi:ppGpp synthetase/RelA/SpoT-type nucleotidyltranferase